MEKRAIAALLFLSLASGCTYPIFEQPLVAPDECEGHPELHGVLKVVDHDDDEPAYLHVGSAGDKFPSGFLKFISVHFPGEENALESQEFVGFVEQIRGDYILHIPMPDNCTIEQQLEELGYEWNADRVTYYSLLRLTKTDAGYSVAVLDAKLIVSQIKGGKLEGRAEENVRRPGDTSLVGFRAVRVTTRSAELKEFFESTPLDEIFEDGVLEFKVVK